MGRRPTAGTTRTDRRLAPALAPLEGRALLSTTTLVIPGLTATATPSTLFPADGRYVPVTIKGTIAVVEVSDGKVKPIAPGQIKRPPTVDIMVNDEYRRVEPHVRAQPVAGQAAYTFSKTIYLKASRVTQFVAGRRYYVVVAARTENGSAGVTLPVQVPVSLTQRGPGPEKVPFPTVHAQPPRPHKR